MKKAKRVFLIGAGTTAEAIADTDGDRWGCNNLYNKFPSIRFDRWFELHKFERRDGVLLRRGVRSYCDVPIKRYMAYLNAMDCPVLMQQTWPEIPLSVEYPFADVREKFGDYFGCSFAWMTALAIMEGYKEIFYRGVLLAGREYYYQRASTEYMIGRAIGAGIKVAVGADSMLLKEPWVYAIEEDFDMIQDLYGPRAEAVSTSILCSYQQGLINAHYKDFGGE